MEIIKSAFEDQHESLIKYRQGLGEFFGERLERSGFIGIMAPDKTGKSFMLQDLAYRAMLQKRRVAYFECGDNSRNQIMRRFMVRISKHPLKPCTVEYPDSIEIDEENETYVTHTQRKYRHELTWRRAYKACRELAKGKKIKDVLRLSCHYNSTLSIDGMRDVLEGWERENWIPDVVVIDYADIMDMDRYGIEGRDRTDYLWKGLRRISQERHCLVVTATQSNRAAYTAKKIGREHSSEDKRKLAHVTGMLGMNQNSEEKEKGVMRLNWVVLREGSYNEGKFCYVATCLPLANITAKSKM